MHCLPSSYQQYWDSSLHDKTNNHSLAMIHVSVLHQYHSESQVHVMMETYYRTLVLNMFNNSHQPTSAVYTGAGKQAEEAGKYRSEHIYTKLNGWQSHLLWQYSVQSLNITKYNILLPLLNKGGTSWDPLHCWNTRFDHSIWLSYPR